MHDDAGLGTLEFRRDYGRDWCFSLAITANRCRIFPIGNGLSMAIEIGYQSLMRH